LDSEHQLELEGIRQQEERELELEQLKQDQRGGRQSGRGRGSRASQRAVPVVAQKAQLLCARSSKKSHRRARAVGAAAPAGAAHNTRTARVILTHSTRI
jgi:hypothetical protein